MRNRAIFGLTLLCCLSLSDVACGIICEEGVLDLRNARTPSASSSPSSRDKAGQKFSPPTLLDELEQIEEMLPTVKIIDMSDNQFKDDTFRMFTQGLHERGFWDRLREVELLDISFSMATQASAAVLEEWLSLNPRIYIKLDSTPLANQKIKPLLEYFGPERDASRTNPYLVVDRFIFMRKEYINQADRDALWCKDLVTRAIFPANWAQRQTALYETPVYKMLTTYLKRKEHIQYLKFLQRVSPRPASNPEEIAKMVENTTKRLAHISISPDSPQ